MRKNPIFTMRLLYASIGLIMFANLHCAKEPIQTPVAMDLVSKTINEANVGRK
jgi:hypothetical protein